MYPQESYAEILQKFNRGAYSPQQEAIAKEINGLELGTRYANITLISPNRLYINYSTFKQSPEEKGKAITARHNHRANPQVHYGRKWKKYLNIPGSGIEASIKMSF